jgi:two-component system OmpR family response regulator
MRLLLVEDDVFFADGVASGLRKQGYAVDVAYDGEHGYELARINDYDLLILDLLLPDLPGQDICKALREEQTSLRILMLTSLGEPEQRIAGLDLGADDYLPKPFVWEELLARIRALLRREVSGGATAIRCGDLSLDVAERTAWLAGCELKLTRKEFGILEYLMRHPRRIVSTEELLEHVWDGSVNVFTNTVRVHVNALRRKLGDNANQARYIETVQGVGYRMLAPPATTSPVQRPTDYMG